MKRSLGLLSIVIVVAIPSSASAFFPCWCPFRGYYAGPPIVHPAPYFYPAAHSYAAPYVVPMYAPVYPLTLVYPQTFALPVPIAQSPRQPVPTAPPSVEIVRPAASVPQSTTVTPAAAINPVGTPGIDPARVQPMPTVLPKSTAKVPTLSIPSQNIPIDTVAPSLPPIKLPDLPSSKEMKSPVAPASTVPFATPSSAPPPSDTGLLPPKLPTTSEIKPAVAPSESLPPLVLPPEGLAPPSGVIPSESISRSSPLSSGIKVRVFQAKGEVTGSTRRIGFFNHTDRDLALVIEGKSVALPKKTYLHAVVAAEFRWSHSDNPAETTTVPPGSSGLDILFRE